MGCPSHLYGRSFDEARVTARNAMRGLDPAARVGHISDLTESAMESLDVQLKCQGIHVPYCSSSAEIMEFQQAAGAIAAALLTVPSTCETLPETAEVNRLLGSIAKCRDVAELQSILDYVHASDSLSSAAMDALRPALAFVRWRLSECFDYPVWKRKNCPR
jgi:hypothetical protein